MANVFVINEIVYHFFRDDVRYLLTKLIFFVVKDTFIIIEMHGFLVILIINEINSLFRWTFSL